MMNDNITQMRLSMRLDAYLRDYTEKSVKNAALPQKEWDTVWQVAHDARIGQTLTPEQVDDVRKALKGF